MERSTVYVLLRKNDLDSLKTADSDKFNALFGKAVKDGWASIKDYKGAVHSHNEESLNLIIIDDVKWDRYYSDVDAIYDFLNTLDYWEVLQIREDGAVTQEADENTEEEFSHLLAYENNIDLSNLKKISASLTENDLPELVGQIIDECEDYFDNNSIVLTENPERDEAIADGEDPEGLAQIYGTNYELLAESIRPTLKKLIACPTTMNSEEAEKLADNVITALWGIMLANKAELTDKSKVCKDNTDLKELKQKIIDTLENWNLVGESKGKYLLIHVCEREIETHFFESFKQARQMMEMDFNDIVIEGDLDPNDKCDCSIEKDCAYANWHDNGHDWKIIEVA